jgi:hypothetical protein
MDPQQETEDKETGKKDFLIPQVSFNRPPVWF